MAITPFEQKLASEVSAQAALTASPSLRELVETCTDSLAVKNQTLEASQLVEILGELAKKKHLKSLELVSIEMPVNGHLFLSQGLQRLQWLLELNLSNTQMTDVGASHLSIILSHPDCLLEILNLSNNQIGDLGCNALLFSLNQNKYLSRLNLSRNPIKQELQRQMQTSLVQLTLSRLRDQKFDAIIDRIIKGNCLFVDLGGMALKDPGIYQLISVLFANNTVRTLNLDKIKFSKGAAKYLVKTVIEQSRPSSLVSLSLQFAEIDDEIAKEILAALPKNTGLTHLNLDNNKIDQKILDEINAILNNRQGNKQDTQNFVEDIGSSLDMGNTQEIISALMSTEITESKSVMEALSMPMPMPMPPKQKALQNDFIVFWDYDNAPVPAEVLQTVGYKLTQVGLQFAKKVTIHAYSNLGNISTHSDKYKEFWNYNIDLHVVPQKKDMETDRFEFSDKALIPKMSPQDRQRGDVCLLISGDRGFIRNLIALAQVGCEILLFCPLQSMSKVEILNNPFLKNKTLSWEEFLEPFRPKSKKDNVKRCMQAYFCERGMSCKSFHAISEIRSFQKNGGKPFKKERLVQCNIFRCGNKDCTFAHNPQQFICYYCGVQGHHLYATCPEKIQDQKTMKFTTWVVPRDLTPEQLERIKNGDNLKINEVGTGSPSLSLQNLTEFPGLPQPKQEAQVAPPAAAPAPVTQEVSPSAVLTIQPSQPLLRPTPPIFFTQNAVSYQAGRGQGGNPPPPAPAKQSSRGAWARGRGF